MHNGKVQVRSLNTANQQVIHIIRSNANHNTRKSLCMGKVGSYCFSETLADTIHVHGAQGRFGMCLDIDWIASEYLRTTGKDDALAGLILCCSKDVVSPLDIVVEKLMIKISVRIGICRKVDDHIDISTGVLARFEIGNVKCNHLMLSRGNLANGSRIHVCQAERVLSSSRAEKCRTNPSCCTS